MMGIVPFLLAIGHKKLLPCLAIQGLPSLPNQAMLDKKETYFSEVSHIVMWIYRLGGNYIR